MSGEKNSCTMNGEMNPITETEESRISDPDILINQDQLPSPGSFTTHDDSSDFTKRHLTDKAEIFASIQRSSYPIVTLMPLPSWVLAALMEKGIWNSKEAIERSRNTKPTETETSENQTRSEDPPDVEGVSCKKCTDGKCIFTCLTCSHQSNSESKMRAHLLSHGGKWYRCFECDFRTNYVNNLKAHLRCHDDTTKIFKCNLCVASFRAECDLKRHVCTHTRQKVFECTQCEFSTHLKGCLRLHQKTHGDKKYTCHVCNYKSHGLTLLKNHIQSHTGQSFVCTKEGCNYKSHNMANLKKHLLMHDKPNTFKCSDCSYTTHRKDKLVRHYRCHSTEVYKSCSFCDFKTKWECYMKIHEKSHQEKQLSCTYCDYKTHTKLNLKEHLASHDESKWIKCDKCGFKSHLKRYMKVVHPKKCTGDPYKRKGKRTKLLEMRVEDGV